MSVTDVNSPTPVQSRLRGSQGNSRPSRFAARVWHFLAASTLVLSSMLYGSAILRAQSQDVAEAARQERARKQAQQKKNKHVYTNEDLSRAKILTPEDQSELDAKKQECAQKKNCAPVEKSQDALDADSQKPGTSLGEIARELRRQKELQKELEALKPKQSEPFHLPSWDEVFASPILPATADVAPRPEVARPKTGMSAGVAARPKVPAGREVHQPVAPVLGAGTGSHVVRRDPFARTAAQPARPKVRPEISAEVSPRLRDEARTDAKPALPDVFAGSKAASAPSAASSFAGTAKPARPRDFSPGRPNAPEKAVAPQPENVAPTVGAPAQPRSFVVVKPAAPAQPKNFAVARPNAPATHSHAARPAAPPLATPVAPGTFALQPQTVAPVRPKSFASVKPNAPQRDRRSNQAAVPALAKPVAPATTIETEKPNVVAPMEPVAPATAVLPAVPSAVEPTRPRNFGAVKPNAPVAIPTEQAGEPALARPAAPATILDEQPKVKAPEMPAATTTIAPTEPAAAAPSVPAAPATEDQPSAAPIERSKPTEVAPVKPRPVVPSAPEPDVVVPTVPNVGPRIVSVKAGDSLWKVAHENLGSGSRWPEVAAANPGIANPSQIRIGTQLVLPAGAAKAESVAGRGSNTIQVKKGDTLWSLAKSYLGGFSKWPCLAAANPALEDPNRIYEGQELQLPPGCHDSNGGSLRPDEK